VKGEGFETLCPGATLILPLFLRKGEAATQASRLEDFLANKLAVAGG
jgi:hypothetical protein